MTARALSLAVALVLAAGPARLLDAQAQAPGARPASFTLLSREGRRLIATTTAGGQELVSLEELAAIFQLAVEVDRATGGLTVSSRDGKTIVLTPGQNLASVSGRLFSLPSAPVRDARGWLVPVEFVRAIALALDARIELRKPSRLIVAGDLAVPRVAVQAEAFGNQLRLTFDVAPPTPHAIVQEPGRLLVRFDADALDAALPALPSRDLVETVRVADTGNAVALDTGPRFGSFRAADLPPQAGHAAVVIDVMPPATEAMPQPAPPPPEPPPVETAPPGLRAIVIDPGHGGEEQGARGPGGTFEKDVTMSVARRLKGALEGRLGVRVLLTRDGDETVPLDDRASIANNNKADLFISLHANASVRATTGGAEVFYLSLDEYGDEAKRLAADDSERLPVFGGTTRDIEIILWEMAQARHIERSALFAQIVEEQLRARVPMSHRAIQQAPFRVLVGANMPAVLVEMGFISNADQEHQLASDAFQTSIVQGLLESVVRFRDQAYGAARAAAPSATAQPAPRPPERR